MEMENVRQKRAALASISMHSRMWWVWCIWCRVQTLMMDHKRRLKRYSYVVRMSMRVAYNIKPSLTKRNESVAWSKLGHHHLRLLAQHWHSGYRHHQQTTRQRTTTMINAITAKNVLFWNFVYFRRIVVCQRNRFVLLNDLCCTHWPAHRPCELVNCWALLYSMQSFIFVLVDSVVDTLKVA